MPEDILDDSLESNDNKNGLNHFILTKKATLYLYKAAQWARVLAVIVILLSFYRFANSIINLSSTRTIIGSESISSRLWGFLDLIPIIFIIGANICLITFSNNFIKGYNLDSDNLIDSSIKNLQYFFTYSAITVGLSIVITIVSVFYSEISKYLILVIPVALLILFFYQNNILDNDK